MDAKLQPLASNQSRSFQKPVAPARQPCDTFKDEFLKDARKVLEVGTGVIYSASRIFSTALPSLVVGGLEAARRAEHPEGASGPASLSRQMATGKAVQALLPATLLGLALAGPPGAAAAFAGQAVSSATSLALYAKGGAAELVGEGLAQDFTTHLGSETGIGWGMLVGLWSGVKHNARAGYQEGKGVAAGFLEGCKALKPSFNGDKDFRLSDSWPRRVGQTLAGAVAATLCAPAGTAHGMVHALSGSENWSLAKQTAITAGALGFTVASTGLGFGLVGASLVGGAAAAGLGGLCGLLAGRNSIEAVAKAVDRAQQDNVALPTMLGETRQKAVEGALSGAAAAAGVGWRMGAGLLEAG